MNPHAPFKVAASKNFDTDARTVLHLMYLPLIGPTALSLYGALYALIERSNLRSANYPHKFLYDLLNENKQTFMTARRKLEACGLLDTYAKQDEIIYELHIPLGAETFIKDSPFAAYLYKNLGEKRFEELIEFFKIRRIRLSDYKNVSVTFTDVFTPAYQKITTRANYLEAHAKRPILKTSFDTELFIASMPKSMLHSSTKTKRMKERLAQIAYVYSLDETTMKTLVLGSLKPDTSIDMDALTRACQKHYQNEPKHQHTKKTASFDIDYFKHTNPTELIEDLTGSRVPASDVKIIEKMVTQSDLTIEVINVLIAYVLKELNHQFPTYNYFEKVMAEWKRANVTDAESAIEHIRNRKAKRKQTPRKKFVKTLPEDIHVEWFDNYLKKMEEDK